MTLTISKIIKALLIGNAIAFVGTSLPNIIEVLIGQAIPRFAGTVIYCGVMISAGFAAAHSIKHHEILFGASAALLFVIPAILTFGSLLNSDIRNIAELFFFIVSAAFGGWIRRKNPSTTMAMA